MALPGLYSDPEPVMNSSLCCLGSSLQEDKPSWHSPMTTLVKTEAVFMSLACGVGLIANTLVLCVLLSSWSRLHLSARYAIHRAIADILFLITIAFDVPMHVQDSWIFGSALCKLRSALAVIGQLVSSAMLMALTSNCFLEFCKPGIPLKDRSALLRTISVVAWSISIIFGIPIFLLSEILKEVTREHFHCVSLPLSEDTTPSQILRFIFMFLVFVVPLITNWVLVTNWSILDQQITSKAITLEMRYPWALPRVLLLVFTMCQLPYWVPYLIRELVRDDNFSDAALLMIPATMCLPPINAALNPVLCAYFIKDLRKTKAKEKETQEDYEIISLGSLSSRNHNHHASHISLK